ncbi:MAG: PEP-CTERM sorting domain-containing protein [Phycisphaerae bacterium]
MKLARVASVVLVGSLLVIASSASAETKHRDLQAVDEDGVSTWSGSHPFTVTGVILNNPEDMLDPTFDPTASPTDTDNGRMGGEWQLFIQGVGDDRGGTALWMGQNYNSLGPWIPAGNSYNETDWTSEMTRVNYDATGRRFRQGDLVEVTANKSLFYGGKRNVNESHRTTRDNNFSISLVTADYGLPTAEALSLSDLYASTSADGYDSKYPMFDQTRNTGAEHYQGMYVRLNGLTLTDSSGWDGTAWDDRLCTVADDLGHTLNFRMPLYDLGDVPTGVFDAYGIINQESGSGTNGRMGYELFVTSVVPEPASLSLLTFGALACLRRRRK